MFAGATARGDEGAWEALVMRYQRLIYAIPRRAGLDEDAAATGRRGVSGLAG